MNHLYRPEDIQINNWSFAPPVELAIREYIAKHRNRCYVDQRSIHCKVSVPPDGNVFYRSLDEGQVDCFAYYCQAFNVIVVCFPEPHETQTWVFATDKASCENALLRLAGAMAFEKPRHRIYVTAMRYGEPYLKPFVKNVVPLERGNYEDGVLEAFDFMVQELSTEEPTGRLTIFNGPPGTGKTHMLQSIPCHVPGAVIFGTPELVSGILQGAHIARFETLREQYEKAPTVLCIEDADECLAPRDGGNMGMIASVLNLTDGMLGRQLDLRFVLTTNSTVNDFETAIMRPGRLSRLVDIGSLSVETANKIARRLGYPEHIKNACTLAEVYALARGSKVRKRTAPRVGFSA